MQRKERARIASALIGDALRHRLGALKMLAGVEVGALPAGMEFCPALGTLAERIVERRGWCFAGHAAGGGPGLGDCGGGRSGRVPGVFPPLLFLVPLVSLDRFSIFRCVA